MTEVMNKEFSRKSFVKGGGAMLVGFTVAGAAVAGGASAADSPFASNGPPDPTLIDSWITIHADNTASINAGRVELGQGSSVGMAMIAAEELDMNLGQITMLNQDTKFTVNTGANSASATVKDAGPLLRAAAVAARNALLGLAAVRLAVPVSGLSVSGGVVAGGGRAVTYGELLGGKLFNVAVPASYGFNLASVQARSAAGLQHGASGSKPVAQYKLVGTSQPRFDIPDKVSGKFTYIQNIRLPGMVHARVVRPRGQAAYPSGAPVLSVDESSIKHIAGARVVRQGDFLAVVAAQEYAAIQAAGQLKVRWAEPPPIAGSGNTWKQMRDFDTAGQAPARITFDGGNVDTGLAGAAAKVAATYEYHHNGHLPIGPTCALANVQGTNAVVFSNTLDVYATRTGVARVLNLPVNNVRVVFAEGSSVYGTSPFNDAAQAAALTSQIVGKPVRLQFMRWDEHGWDFYGLLAMVDMRGGADRNGKIVAQEYTGFAVPGTGLNDTTTQLTGAAPVPTPGLGSVSVSGLEVQFGQQYLLPNRRVIAKSLPLFNNYFKTSPLRGVYSVQASFATEQLVDELAHTSGMDPVEFRRRNIDPSDGGRSSSVLELVAKMANWQPKVAASAVRTGEVLRGRGVALGGISFTRTAIVADVEVNTKTGKVVVKEIWAAENAGLAVNPEGMHNQMIGCIGQGISRALAEQVTFNTERVTSLDWVSYPILRFKDSPRMHVATVQQPELKIGGSSEATLVPVPAAIANAVFDATGVRVREAPMTPARVRAVLKAGGN